MLLLSSIILWASFRASTYTECTTFHAVYPVYPALSNIFSELFEKAASSHLPDGRDGISGVVASRAHCSWEGSRNSAAGAFASKSSAVGLFRK